MNSKLYFSVISIFELNQKAQLGKITVSENLVQQLEALDITNLGFSIEATQLASTYSRDRLPDPFDRMIVATAESNGLLLMSSDAKILDLGQPWLIDAYA